MRIVPFALRFAIVLGVALVLGRSVLERHPVVRFGVDDANIFFTYAKHLLDGHGLVFNAGGERVEGFSSPLWLAITTLAGLSTSMEAILRLVNACVVSFALALLAGLIDAGPRDPEGRRSIAGTVGRALSVPFLLILGWTFARPAYLSWTTLTLMETGVWSALLITTTVVTSDFVRSDRPTGRASAALATLLALLVLCRPEGGFWAFVFLLVGALSRVRRSGSWRRGIASVLVPLAATGATVGGATLFRLVYFGHPLPNTYYAKVSPDWGYNVGEGLVYALRFLSENGFAAVFVAVALASALVLARRFVFRTEPGPGSEDARFVVSVVVSVGLVVPVLVGGDHFGSFRFYQPIWPLLPVPAYFLVMRLSRRFRPQEAPGTTLGYAAVLLATVAFSLAGPASWRDLQATRILHEFGIAANGRRTGEHANRLFPPDRRPRIGVIASGGVGYAYAGEVVDLMGLNDTRMAHHPGDRRGMKNHAAFSAEVFHELAPDVVIEPLYCLVPDGVDLRSVRREIERGIARRALADLFRDPAFRSRYALAAVRRAGPPASSHGRLCGYYRRDFLAELAQDPRYDVRTP